MQKNVKNVEDSDKNFRPKGTIIFFLVMMGFYIVLWMFFYIMMIVRR